MTPVHAHRARSLLLFFPRFARAKSGFGTREREQSSFQIWAAILASVAVRAERLKQLAREQPDSPAEEHFTQSELEAIVILRRPKGHHPGLPVTLGQAVRWLADLGGYTGNSRSGPPGSITLGRGLARLEPAATVLGRLRREGKG